MAEMIFFMNPECSECQLQRDNLIKAGNTLECHDITYGKWERNDLLPYFRGREVLQMINCNAPAVKSGKIDPIVLSFDEALTLMTETPELIKGPLIRVDDLFLQGTQDARLQRYCSIETLSEYHRKAA